MQTPNDDMHHSDAPNGGRTMNNANSFWTFSLKFYSRGEVEAIFLDLQDRFGADVNIVLYGLWQASRGRRLSDGDSRDVIAFVRAWQENVVRPLRTARRFLKAPMPDWPSQDIDLLRQRIKAEELQAEHLQQTAMETNFADLGELDDAKTAAAFNMKTYAHILDIEFPATHIETLLDRLEKDRIETQ
jgi:uncharacterized protein (TIGR02444 family)